jgi:periplasmic protein TonB
LTRPPALAQNVAMAIAVDIAGPPDDHADQTSAGARSNLGFDLGLSAALPLIPPADGRDRVGWARCILAAVALHVAVLAFVNWPRSDRAVGAGGTDLEAISIDVVSASAIEANVTAIVVDSAAAMARLARQEGAERQQTAAMDIPDRKRETKPDAPAKAADLVVPDIIVKPEPLIPDAPAIVIAPTKSERPVEGPQTPNEQELQMQATIAAAPSAPSDPPPAETLGGATARGTSVVALAAQSAAIASAGEISAYGSSVQRAVAQNPPKVPRGIRMVGDVKIEFALALDGSLAYARVIASSGDAALDETALAAVRTAKFPAPPAGSKAGELTYTIPMKFR